SALAASTRAWPDWERSLAPRGWAGGRRWSAPAAFPTAPRRPTAPPAGQRDRSGRCDTALAGERCGDPTLYGGAVLVWVGPRSRKGVRRRRGRLLESTVARPRAGTKGMWCRRATARRGSTAEPRRHPRPGPRPRPRLDAADGPPGETDRPVLEQLRPARLPAGPPPTLLPATARGVFAPDGGW